MWLKRVEGKGIVSVYKASVRVPSVILYPLIMFRSIFEIISKLEKNCLRHILMDFPTNLNSERYTLAAEIRKRQREDTKTTIQPRAYHSLDASNDTRLLGHDSKLSIFPLITRVIFMNNLDTVQISYLQLVHMYVIWIVVYIVCS